LAEEIRKNCRSPDKTIIFCRTYEDISHIHLYLKSVLGEEMTGYPDVSQFRLIDKFTACTTPDVKDCIIKSFAQWNGKLRVIVATVWHSEYGFP